MITDSPDINEGRPLIITCNATGVPPPGFVWRKITGDVVDFGRVMVGVFVLVCERCIIFLF